MVSRPCHVRCLQRMPPEPLNGLKPETQGCATAGPGTASATTLGSRWTPAAPSKAARCVSTCAWALELFSWSFFEFLDGFEGIQLQGLSRYSYFEMSMRHLLASRVLWGFFCVYSLTRGCWHSTSPGKSRCRNSGFVCSDAWCLTAPGTCFGECNLGPNPVKKERTEMQSKYVGNPIESYLGFRW